MRPDYADVRGFNYQQSTGTTSLENWLYYDPNLFELELRRGKEYFSRFNTVRLWLSWDAYIRNPGRFAERFESMLTITDRLGQVAIPCLFNRWHDVSGFDNGGVYLDNFLTPQGWAHYVPEYEAYIADVVGAHRGDPRILLWDLCNEPMPYNSFGDDVMPLVEPELRWLGAMHAAFKAADPQTPVGISVHNYLGLDGLRWVEPISDVLLIHPYFMCTSETLHDEQRRAKFDRHVAEYVEFAGSVGKPLLVTETVWGSEDDAERVEILRFTLSTLTKYGLGFLPHALHYSMACDLHLPEEGLVGEVYLPFTNKDGTLRAGHEAFNEF